MLRACCRWSLCNGLPVCNHPLSLVGLTHRLPVCNHIGMIDWVERLKRIQGGKAMTDKRFARMLKIDNSYWSLLKRGKRQPGRKLIGAALKTFPEIVTDKELALFILPKEVAGRQP